ncbi:A/G-specific adenine glycosylase [Gorillibacterium sp. sgz5001074]|uniref:A/G-specific adenine glycosylase n=1 Tax=Gorillibacterium sp. sgz5001074 TaxID=3446695 RepID=UPI003F667B64
MKKFDSLDETKKRFSEPLLEWYRSVRRDLPWRRSRDPYRIWVSEIMLQQTRVETVIPYFNRFMEWFPTVEALAYAPEERLLKAWEGLGYYSRARNLQAAAREVCEQYGGRVPDTKEGVSGLKGVGPYTAGAILSIAFNQPEPAVDGNVMRVLSRYLVLEEDIAKPSTRIGIEKLAQALIPEGTAGDFNQALMELGATICTPKAAHCLPCPVMEWCGARLEGRVDELPVKAKAKPPRTERRAVALVEGTGEHAGRVLVRQRPADGLLARLWELPHVQLPDGPSAAAGEGAAAGSGRSRGAARRGRGAGASPVGAEGGPQAAEAAAAASAHGRAMGELAAQLAGEDGVGLVPVEWLMDAEHTFSHIHWDMAVYRCLPAPGALPGAAYAAGTGARASAAAAAAAPPGAGSMAAEAPGPGYGGAIAPAGAPLPPGYRWLDFDEMDKYAFPNVFLRILQAYRKART